ncbi:MAG TPA: hypothetical protein VIM08_11390 [Arthrobacter sp.]
MRRTVLGILAALFLLNATACSISTVDPGYVAPPPLAPLDQLEQAALANPADYAVGDGVLSFITADHNVACSLTSARGEHLNLPYEANSFGDPANNKLATVPVAHCELAAYAKPASGDVKDDCAGTGVGYLGGSVLLTPDTVRYGECRSGVTQMEAAYGPQGSKGGPIARLPVLAEGQTIERNGLRCSAYNGGVACGNVSAGVAFFVTRARYELFSKAADKTSQAPAEPSKTP